MARACIRIEPNESNSLRISIKGEQIFPFERIACLNDESLPCPKQCIREKCDSRENDPDHLPHYFLLTF